MYFTAISEPDYKVWDGKFWNSSITAQKNFPTRAMLVRSLHEQGESPDSRLVRIMEVAP
ncbi:hypothetical protein SCBWM1_gp5 [Synechococcus phage S-CBWM1]|uniref:Uncharacterized protein n=1 Tax=Synechococcus phage S-CBWM1 TaxID=2053653 RepID=A0A3G1L3B5_9CAUD|nr:hypothetical protein HOU61_gp006 [Synechococcus phage S-CBWM1]ATW62689.1 hypothetical protein SCBWM1_gp5 [Synechococcus phage S-CBWM1]